VSIDAPANNAKCPDDSVTSTLTWVTDEAPSDIFAEGDAGNRKLERRPRLAVPISPSSTSCLATLCMGSIGPTRSTM
jgi:hypothetical protein